MSLTWTELEEAGVELLCVWFLTVSDWLKILLLDREAELFRIFSRSNIPMYSLSINAARYCPSEDIEPFETLSVKYVRHRVSEYLADAAQY